MMMMPLARKFEPGRLAWDIDGIDEAFIGEQFERAVDRRDTDSADDTLGSIEDFFGRKRASGDFEYVADRLALPGIALACHERE